MVGRGGRARKRLAGAGGRLAAEGQGRPVACLAARSGHRPGPECVPNGPKRRGEGREWVKARHCASAPEAEERQLALALAAPSGALLLLADEPLGAFIGEQVEEKGPWLSASPALASILVAEASWSRLWGAA